MRVKLTFNRFGPHRTAERDTDSESVLGHGCFFTFPFSSRRDSPRCHRVTHFTRLLASMEMTLVVVLVF